MSLSTPQTVTVNSVDYTLNRISSDATSSVYQTAEEDFLLKISHQASGSRTRRMVRLDNTEIAADPLTAENSYQKAGVYIVIDEPQFGFDDADLQKLVGGLVAWLTSANILAVLASRH